MADDPQPRRMSWVRSPRFTTSTEESRRRYNAPTATLISVMNVPSRTRTPGSSSFVSKSRATNPRTPAISNGEGGHIETMCILRRRPRANIVAALVAPILLAGAQEGIRAPRTRGKGEANKMVCFPVSPTAVNATTARLLKEPVGLLPAYAHLIAPHTGYPFVYGRCG